MRKFIVFTLVCSIYADNINSQSAVAQMTQEGSAFGQPGAFNQMATAMSQGGLSASQVQGPMVSSGMPMQSQVGIAGPSFGQEFMQQQYGPPIGAYGSSPYMQSQIGRRYGALIGPPMVGPPMVGPPIIGPPVMGPPIIGPPVMSYGSSMPYYNNIDPYYNSYYY